MEELLQNGPKFWIVYGVAALIVFFLWTKFSEANPEDSKSRFGAGFVFWLFSALLLSAPLGWQASELNRKHKEEQAELDRQKEEERLSALAKIALDKKRVEVAKNRAEALKSEHAIVALKSNRILQNVAIASFNDDGISFTGEAGGARVRWEDLPVEWVEKFRDPVTAEAALKSKSDEAALLAQIEKAGVDIQVTFTNELNTNQVQQVPVAGARPVKVAHTMGSGSIVNVVSYKVEGLGWKENTTTSYIFLMGVSQSAFAQGPFLKMRAYPLPEKILFYQIGKNGAPFGAGERVPSYCGSAALSLQYMHEAEMPIAELVKRKYGAKL